MNNSGKKNNRRDFLFTATYTIGAVGIGATIWPFIDQMNPDSSVKALATTEVDISQIEPGKSITVLWRGKPVFIKRRTQTEISEAQSVSLEERIWMHKLCANNSQAKEIAETMLCPDQIQDVDDL